MELNRGPIDYKSIALSGSFVDSNAQLNHQGLTL